MEGMVTGKIGSMVNPIQVKETSYEEGNLLV